MSDSPIELTRHDMVVPAAILPILYYLPVTSTTKSFMSTEPELRIETVTPGPNHKYNASNPAMRTVAVNNVRIEN